MALKKPQATEALFKTLNSICAFEQYDGLKIAVIGAYGDSEFQQFKEAEVDFIQSFKPAINSLSLNMQSSQLVDELSEGYDLILHFPTKFQEENLMFLAKAIGVLKTGGQYIATLSNKIGAKGFEKEVMALVDTASSTSKRKCRVIEFTKTQAIATPKQWRDFDGVQKITGTDYITFTGVYGGKKVDAGSEALIDYLKENVKLFGHGADLGAGWGYLTDQVLNHYPKLRGVDAYEAEGRALKAAEKNVKDIDRARLFHCDVVGESISRKYDFVVMNPPFHNTEEEDIDLGRQFIAKAKSILKPRGTVYIVANKHLPYEKNLRELFTNVDVIPVKGFKIIVAK